MIEKIKEAISQQYSLEEMKGIFLSCFNKDGLLILSNGVLTTNKSLWTVVDMLYHGLIEEKMNTITKILCDIVTETQLLNTMDDINKIDMSKSGISISTLDYTKTGAILPGTEGITSLSHMLQIVKEKNHIEGNVIIHSFQSTRIEIIV